MKRQQETRNIVVKKIEGEERNIDKQHTKKRGHERPELKTPHRMLTPPPQWQNCQCIELKQRCYGYKDAGPEGEKVRFRLLIRFEQREKSKQNKNDGDVVAAHHQEPGMKREQEQGD